VSATVRGFALFAGTRPDGEHRGTFDTVEEAQAAAEKHDWWRVVDLSAGVGGTTATTTATLALTQTATGGVCLTVEGDFRFWTPEDWGRYTRNVVRHNLAGVCGMSAGDAEALGYTPPAALRAP
jgi:hypothetical protein